MAIKVACVCGQTCAAGEELAGKTMRCPKCGRSLAVPNAGAHLRPGPGTGSSPGAKTAVRRCNQCGSAMSAAAVLCVKCGYDLTGNVSGKCPECAEEVSSL